MKSFENDRGSKQSPVSRLLKLLSEADYRPATLKAVSRTLGIAADDYPEFRGAVKQMIREGKLEYARGKTLRLPRAEKTILGIYRRASGGFGFVRPLEAIPNVDRVYIGKESGLDASSGDEVAIRITGRSPRSGCKLEAKIVKIVARASATFVGTYFEEDDQAYVRVDGSTFHAPILVGDPGVKGAKTGDKVVLEIARYPSPGVEGEGVVVEVLGARGEPGVDTLSVIRAFGIPDEFDDDTLDEARRQARIFDENDLDGRLDLRDVLTVTIDPSNARDFDDAVTLSRDERGFWTLGVHIADVSHFVRPGSALDHDAKKRGTSVYLPDRVIPMLPEILSNGLASLQQDKTRLTLSAFMEFNAEGVRTDRRFARSVIRVDRRFTYEQAYEAMMNPDKRPEGISEDVHRLLGRMLDLAMILRKRRRRRGALELSMPEAVIDLGVDGEVIGAHLASDDESHQVIEEFMLAANEAVASFLTERHVDFLRRGHADPDEAKLLRFAEFARSLGYEIESPRSRFELQRVLDESADRPERHAVHYGLLRALKQARYSAEQEGHYALASEDYCHFTSPIRRYPDLQVHRRLVGVLADENPRIDPAELVELAEHCTRTERRAEAAERDLIRIKLLTHLEKRIGEVFHAVLTGVEDFGLFCQLVELPVDGLLHVTSLPDDFYYLESDTHTLIGRRSGKRFRLGDRLEVRVARVDVDRRALDLVPADREIAAIELPPPGLGRRGRAGDRPGGVRNSFSRSTPETPRKKLSKKKTEKKGKKKRR